ncbi:protein RETICULATA-RELATED 3, chloroplastic [Impatiens glandulifera]|uniref:protein RETICULATA-RELATED 3, chloroplastic n=1 Tax=Impatiens glandulifera TaxID=253017 RepID=UPI001FB0D328|nr:protein RETICULATA-RELATED 3, chloroplastic [Impatiens glandulifera]
MATAAQLRHSPVLRRSQFNEFAANRSTSLQSPTRSAISFPHSSSSSSSNLVTLRIALATNPTLLDKFHPPCAVGGGGGGGNDGAGGKSGGGGGGDNDGSEDSSKDSSPSWVGPVGAFLNGWRSRVAADPQFPFKVLMEELVGVSACVLGDMSSRPNFGLNELDFVFSTLVVGCILNFVLMYLLAPTISISSPSLPGLFAKCPTGHMFEPGTYSLVNRFGTFVYKGILFAACGFAAGLVGTAISNGLIKMRKKMDPTFETQNKAPPTLLNAATWATHMGLSSNFRYQTLNGVEFLLDKICPPMVFKSSVIVLRCLNNVLGGMTFVMLARLTGSQSVDGGGGGKAEKEVSLSEKLLEDDEGREDKP